MIPVYLILYNDYNFVEEYTKDDKFPETAHIRLVNDLKDITVGMSEEHLLQILQHGTRVIMPDFKENAQAPFILRHLFQKMKKFDIDRTKLEQYSQKTFITPVHNYITGEENAP